MNSNVKSFYPKTYEHKYISYYSNNFIICSYVAAWIQRIMCRGDVWFDWHFLEFQENLLSYQESEKKNCDRHLNVITNGTQSVSVATESYVEKKNSSTRFTVYTAVLAKSQNFWDVTTCPFVNS